MKVLRNTYLTEKEEKKYLSFGKKFLWYNNMLKPTLKCLQDQEIYVTIFAFSVMPYLISGLYLGFSGAQTDNK